MLKRQVAATCTFDAGYPPSAHNDSTNDSRGLAVRHLHASLLHPSLLRVRRSTNSLSQVTDSCTATVLMATGQPLVVMVQACRLIEPMSSVLYLSVRYHPFKLNFLPSGSHPVSETLIIHAIDRLETPGCPLPIPS